MPDPLNRLLPATQILALIAATSLPGDPAALANGAKAQLDALLTQDVCDDLNDGQYAALIHCVIVQGADAFAQTRLLQLVLSGNLTLAPNEFASFGDMGQFELRAWQLGNAP